MCGQCLRLGVVAVLVVGLALLRVPMTMAAPDQQVWYFLRYIDYAGTAADDGTIHERDEVMSKAELASGSAKYVDIWAGRSAWWYAENAAQCDLGFGEEGTWTVHLHHESIDAAEADKALSVDVYAVSIDGSLTHLAGGSVTTAEGDPVERTIGCSDDAGTLHDFTTGQRLAVRISGDFDEADKLRVFYYSADNADSCLTSPPADPGYPVPEFPSAILAGMGLLLLALWAWPRTTAIPCRSNLS